MANSLFHHSKISGISCVVGNKEICIDDERCYYQSLEQLERVKKTVGFNKRRIVEGDITTADLCLSAAQKLCERMNLSPADIDAIVFVTQTPDYYMPGNAHILHKALGLSKKCMAFDLEFGCSGYIYGLYFSYLLVEQGCKCVLLLTGDTLSKIINKRNRADAPVFGDAGCATIIEHTQEITPAYFCMYSDGSGYDMMIKKAGAYRFPSTPETKAVFTDENGNTRSLEDFYMHGFDVFNFTLTEQPKLLKEILEYSEKDVNNIDYFVLHQANTFIVDTISRKAKIPAQKILKRTFSEFGNQSSASIPATISNEIAELDYSIPKNFVLQGYGIGLSWGACQIELYNTVILKPFIYGE